MPAIADLQPTTIPHALCTNNKPRCNTCSIYMHILTAKLERKTVAYRMCGAPLLARKSASCRSGPCPRLLTCNPQTYPTLSTQITNQPTNHAAIPAAYTCTY